MAKTELTREIEQALRYHHPTEVCGRKINKFRPTHTAFEVPAVCGTTTGGIVDAVRVQEYFGDVRTVGTCAWKHREGKGWGREMMKTATCPAGYGPGSWPETCQEPTCRFRLFQHEGTPAILITCYEIKITRSDFKSKNGHNFIGNCNYYIIPKELYPEVADLVPEDIGIILYLSAGSYVGLRRKKECAYKELTDEAQKWLVLSVAKRLEETTWKEYQAGHTGKCDDCDYADTCDQKIDTGVGWQEVKGCDAWKRKGGGLWT